MAESLQIPYRLLKHQKTQNNNRGSKIHKIKSLRNLRLVLSQSNNLFPLHLLMQRATAIGLKQKAPSLNSFSAPFILSTTKVREIMSTPLNRQNQPPIISAEIL